MIDVEFDLIIIGTGTAASTAALACRSVGWKVAIIDSLPFGGTCALRGCEPKKVLVEAAKTIDSSKRHQNKGITGSERIRINWSDLIRFKRTFTDPVPHNVEGRLTGSGIETFHGRARFTGTESLAVGNNRVLNSRFILIATGAMPMNLNIPGSENVTTSDQFLKIEGDNLPNRIVFVGGGYISFEFAHIAARAGAEVTILHRGKQSLERFDPDLVNQLVQKSREIGIDVQVQKIVRGIDKTSDGKLVVHASDAFAGDDKVSITLETDMVVHGAGRVPNIEGLDLMAAGVEHNITGVKVNEYLQSVSNPAVYAAGDVAASGGSPLTPVASYDGHIVANNLTKGNTLKANYTGLPSVVFTTPPLASVGMREQEAKEQGIRFKTKYKNTSSWYSSRRVGETCSGFKVLIEEESTRILGAHILGPNAEEVINIFSIAIRLGLTAKHLNDPILYAFPTNSSDVVYML